MTKIEWHGLYSESWGNDLVPEAYVHPAKYSRGLIRQIYRYMLAEGMIAPGDVIGDPFGGQAGGALDAMRFGLHWRGVELEPRFIELGSQNIELWNGRYAPHFERWGTAALVQGDSRNFAEIVGGVACVVSSPPYADAINNEKNGINWQKAKKDYPGRVVHDDREKMFQRHHDDRKYGTTKGQLGSMKEGSLDAAISSPPYGDTIENGDGPGARWDFAAHRNGDKISSAASYGTSAGQVGRLDGCVTSPPFEAQQSGGGLALPGARHNDGHKFGDNHGYQQQAESDGNLANDTGDTFWTASRVIVEQVYLALKPGGYVAWVTGDFVRKGKRVHFGQQWLALCEAVGFEAVAWAVAWKTEHHGVQRGIFGDVEKRKDRVSFFRRLANEKNPDAAILNEDVIFMQKPLSNDGEVAQ